MRVGSGSLSVAAAVCVLMAPGLCMGQDESKGAGYEQPPSVPVENLLKPAYLSGNSFKLTEEAQADGMLYSFSMWTPAGWYRPQSLAMLQIRIAESRALAALNSMKDDPLFLQGMTDSAATTVKTTAQAVTHPLKTIRSVPMGLEKFGRNVQARADEGTVAGESGAMRNLAAKRKLALELGIDPYSDNAQLQEALNTVANHKNSGAIAAKIGGMAVGGTSGAVISAAQVNKSIQNKLRDMSAPELQKANRKALEQLGCPSSSVDNFLKAKGYTVTRTTAITDAMTQLSGVRNICQYLSFVKSASQPEVPLFHEQQIGMAAGYHSGVEQLVSFSSSEGVAVFTDKQGEKHVFAPIDVIYWCPDIHQRLKLVSRNDADLKLHLWITGTCTETAKSKLAEGGVTVHERAGAKLLAYAD